ncbi:TIGR01897 family CRISPR-associated protein [Thermococci archaeon]|nr:MAG: TIGR01897 family CRISPR-associated protein [Thermococci archaeon]
MKLLISPWGNFRSWNEVEYIFNGKSRRSKSPILLLYDIIEPDKTIVILPNTLASDLERADKEVEGEAKEFLKELGVSAEVLVIPGTGKFPNGEFLGHPTDAYYYLTYGLSQEIPVEDLEVHLDITHGLNYLTFFTQRALEDILGILAIGKTVKMTVYNADPFVKGVERLRVNVIEERNIMERPVNEKVGKRVLENYSLDSTEFGKIMAKFKVNSTRLNLWASSILLGLPLLLATTYPDRAEVLQILDEALREFRENIEVQGNILERKIGLGKDFATLSKLAFQIEVINDLLRDMDLPKEELSADELFEIAERVFKGRIRESTKVEVNRIVRKVGDVKEWTKLRTFFPNATPQVDPRNFLAHAGLEANLVEVKREGDVLFRYTKDHVLYGGKMKDPWRVISEILGG